MDLTSNDGERTLNKQINTIRRELADQGYYAEVGNHLGTLADQFNSDVEDLEEMDLDVCHSITQDQRLLLLVESFFDESVLGFYQPFGHNKGSVYSVTKRTGDSPIPLDVLVIQIWASRTRVIFYEGSHSVQFDPEPAKGPNNYWLYLPESLNVTEKRVVDMPNGGLSIIDARLLFEVEKGWGILVGIADQKRLQRWAKMPFSDRDRIKRKVEALQAGKIKLNI